MFSPSHMEIITGTEIAKIIDSLFAVQMKDAKWLLRYVEELLNYLPQDNDKKKTGYEGRADKYYKYLHDFLPNEYKKLLKSSGSVIGQDALTIIFDMVRLIFEFKNEWKKFSEKDTIENVTLRLSGSEKAEDIFIRQVETKEAKEAKVLGVKIPTIPQMPNVNPLTAFSREEKQLAILLTRIILHYWHEQMKNDQEDV